MAAAATKFVETTPGAKCFRTSQLQSQAQQNMAQFVNFCVDCLLAAKIRVKIELVRKEKQWQH